jgi:hypothetical protein
VGLWSERQGERRGLNKVDFRNALFEVLAQLHEQHLFLDAWGDGFMGWGGYIEDPEGWARAELKDSSLWQYLIRPSTVYAEWDPEYPAVDKPKQWEFGVLFDIIELLHRDAAAISGKDETDYDRDGGKRVFRDAVSPVLAQLEPAKVLTEHGEIMNVADVDKESIAIVRRTDSGGDTPTLGDAVYDHIVEIIKRVGVAMELTPGTYVRIDEEARRDVYLVTLNTHYEDQSAGEAFNYAGKTDLRVRHEGNNVFIGECKIWKGPESFTQALNQLFGYAAWRDTKLALIIFVPNKKFSDVIAAAKQLVEDHEQFTGWENHPATAHPMRAKVHWRDDENQHANLAIFLVHLPE